MNVKEIINQFENLADNTCIEPYLKLTEIANELGFISVEELRAACERKEGNNRLAHIRVGRKGGVRKARLSAVAQWLEAEERGAFK
jgi:hypothetical protein